MSLRNNPSTITAVSNFTKVERGASAWDSWDMWDSSEKWSHKSQKNHCHNSLSYIALFTCEQTLLPKQRVTIFFIAPKQLHHFILIP